MCLRPRYHRFKNETLGLPQHKSVEALYEPIQMVDLSRIVSAVQIEDVRLREARCRSLVQPSEIANTLVATPSHETSVAKEPGNDGSLLINTNFSLEIRSGDDEERLQAEVHGVFELSYSIPNKETFSSDELKAFAQVNAVFNVWPYWRELVQASLARMSMPTLTVPVYRLPRSGVAKDEEKSRAKSRKKRNRKA